MNNKINMLIVVSCTALFVPNALSGWFDSVTDIFAEKDTQEITKALSQSSELSVDEITEAFKQSLQIASENVVSQLGAVDGFNADSAVHIPLPEDLQSVKSILDKVGLASAVEDLELKLNRAAEAAAPKAKSLFLNSVKEMSFDDVRAIYNGPDDAATKYFQASMSESLSKEMRPIVESSLAEVGAVQAYDNVMADYKDVPFVPDVKADLTNHVIEKGMQGIFYYIAEQEAAIRADPQKQTTALLKKVFGVE
ncbi:DUF4197 domain-containing protein [Psychromonas ossibalaenae]|uniref:DUF4197 domain-containing protein n=1 Tax=Psychromonas ossibalaenae TaxID=444922 RepID=UPI00036EB19B|nr:DUF4197 domain-containing protein [Psychromonas ossibalaenae]